MTELQPIILWSKGRRMYGKYLYIIYFISFPLGFSFWLSFRLFQWLSKAINEMQSKQTQSSALKSPYMNLRSKPWLPAARMRFCLYLLFMFSFCVNLLFITLVTSIIKTFFSHGYTETPRMKPRVTRRQGLRPEGQTPAEMDDLCV